MLCECNKRVEKTTYRGTLCLYFSIQIIRMIKSRRIRWAGHVARMGDRRGVDKVLVGKTERKRPLGIPRGKLGDNIKIDLQ